jgi:hypothetical protein
MQHINIPSDFDWKKYLELNKDLCCNNRSDAKRHYLEYGIKENRLYKFDISKIPIDFEWKEYIRLNKDLKDIDNKKGALLHYLTYGIKEKRAYKLNKETTNKETTNKETTNKELNVGYDIKSTNVFNDLKNKFNIKSYNNNLNSFLKYDKLNQKTVTHNNYLLFSDINILENFILVIDFPKLGGGTTHFLNTIINKYKYNQPFLILRNINKLINIFLNDEFIFEKRYTDDECINFLKSVSDKIIKIFVNHTQSHSNNFILNLFNLNKQVTFITHDFDTVSTVPQPYYKDLMNNINIKEVNYINNFDKIITQNISNLNIFDKFLNKNKNIAITELPDHKQTLEIVKTNNTKIIIGIIGDISIIKGSYLIEELHSYIKLNDINMEIIIFGTIYPIPKDIVHVRYENIIELNELLIKYKPNVLLEFSIWPETYSYTLTLSMLTKLPIISINKDFKLVIHDRLSKYNKVYFIDKILNVIDIINNVKQDYFFTIDPTIYFSPFFDDYFTTNKNKSVVKQINKNSIIKKNIILITSKIYVSKNKFSYTENRSNYTSEERFNQTLETIETIKKYIPNYFIVLFDNSLFNDNEISILTKSVDKFINITDDEKLNYFTDICEFKAFADISQQIEFYDTFLNDIDENSIINFYKISGRYLINNNFDYSQFDNDQNIMKKNELVTDRNYFFTCFYKLNPKILKFYFKNLKKIIKNFKEYCKMDCEMIIPLILENQITRVDNLGITQRIACLSEGISKFNKTSI